MIEYLEAAFNTALPTADNSASNEPLGQYCFMTFLIVGGAITAYRVLKRRK